MNYSQTNLSAATISQDHLAGRKKQGVIFATELATAGRDNLISHFLLFWRLDRILTVAQRWREDVNLSENCFRK